MLEGLGVDLNGSHFKDTPKRATRAWTNELCSGLGEQSFELTTFDIDPDYEPSMVVLQHIPVKSLCAHHLLPFVGEATVAYIPNKMLCGLSKLALSLLNPVVLTFARLLAITCILYCCAVRPVFATCIADVDIFLPF